MSELHDQIRTALVRAAKGLTARQLLNGCDVAEDLNEVVREVNALKGQAKIVADGMRESQVIYKLGTWPATNGTAVQVEKPRQELVPAPKHSVTTLREGLFDMLGRLRSGQADVQTAKTYAALSLTIIKSVEVQLEYERLRLEGRFPAELTDIPLVPALEHKP